MEIKFLQAESGRVILKGYRWGIMEMLVKRRKIPLFQEE